MKKITDPALLEKINSRQAIPPPTQIGKDIDVLPFETCTFAVEPLLAGGITNRYAFQKLPAIQLGGIRQRFEFGVVGKTLKFQSIDFDQAGFQAHGGSVDLQC